MRRNEVIKYVLHHTEAKPNDFKQVQEMIYYYGEFSGITGIISIDLKERIFYNGLYEEEPTETKKEVIHKMIDWINNNYYGDDGDDEDEFISLDE